jgi:CheY-like chemotaxis protein
MLRAGETTLQSTEILTTAAGHAPKIAVVGGTPANAMVAISLCHAFGCVPTPVPTGEAALGLLRQDSPVDAVLLDLFVPDMDGVVTAQLIRALREANELPMVAVAGSRAETGDLRVRGAGFNAIIVRPYSPRELHGALREALARTTGAQAASSA